MAAALAQNDQVPAYDAGSEPNDNLCVSSARSSCPEQWLADHGDALFRYARARVQNDHAAEDLMQEALLAAWRGRDTFAGKAGEVGGADPLDDIFDADGNWRGAPAPWPEPEPALEQYEFWQVLIDCIAALPPLQARALRQGLEDRWFRCIRPRRIGAL